MKNDNYLSRIVDKQLELKLRALVQHILLALNGVVRLQQQNNMLRVLLSYNVIQIKKLLSKLQK